MKAQSILTLSFLALSLVLPRWSFAQNQLSIQELEDDFGSYVSELSELDELENPEEVTAINISNEQLKTLPKNLTKFPKLRKLVISSEQLTDLTGIEQLSKLEYLDLNYCKELKTLPTNLTKIPNLRVLNLSSTGITAPMGIVSQLKSLEKLTMNFMPNFKDFKGLGNLTKLQHLEFSSSPTVKIPSLPEELAKLTNLTYLHIGSFDVQTNNLESILTPLVNLEHLEISTFDYKTPPVFLSKLTKLKKLVLGGSFNTPLILTGWLDKMQSLEELDLSYALVDAASAPLFGKLANLKRLDIKFSQTEVFPSLPAKLKIVDLFSNDPAAAIPAEIGKYTQLEELHIGSMPITTAPKEIGNMSNLKVLNLQYLELSEIPKEIAQLKKLKRLGLNSNKLSSFPAEITNLPELTHLDVGENENLKELPAACWKHPKLQDLWISKTAISQIPAEVSKNKYDNYDKKLRLSCAETPLASQVEQLSKTFPNLEITAE